MRLFIFFIFFVFSCGISDLDTRKTGLHKVSTSISKAKENGVFVYRLYPNKKTVNIGNNQVDSIREAWIEHSWQYQKQNGETIVKKDSSQQLAIRFKVLPVDKVDIWVKHGNSYLGWNGVATGNNNINLPYHIVHKSVGIKETILDSFILTR